MSFQKNLEILQENSKKLTNTSDNFEELVSIYDSSKKLLEQCNKELKDIELKLSKTNKSRKKIDLNSLFTTLEENKELFQNNDISLEEKVKIYKNSMSLILQFQDKLEKSELKIIECN
jgi:exonuclease VII small subunit